ncbi:MAG: hypothetical protein ACRDX8_05080 [Acidimicrobiales bacterium]
MKTVVLDPLPLEVEHLIEDRRAKGLNLYDEIWEGTYHMSPAPRSRHAYLDNELAIVLGPFARRAGLEERTSQLLGVSAKTLEATIAWPEF